MRNEQLNLALEAMRAEADKSLKLAHEAVEKARADVKFIEGYAYALSQILPAIEEVKKKKKDDSKKEK